MTTEAPVYSARNSQAEFRLLPLEKLVPNQHINSRRNFDEVALADLADSIFEHGLLEPIVVRETVTGMRFEIVAGERRYRACKLAGLDRVPVHNKGQVDDATAVRLALIENLEREDLDPIEEARGYEQLNRIAGMKQADIGAAVKRSQSAIANRMRLLDLPEDIQTQISSGEITPAHGLALLRYTDYPEILTVLAEKCVKGEVNSKDLERGIPFSLGYTLANKGLLVEADHFVKISSQDLKAAGVRFLGDYYTADVAAYRKLVKQVKRREAAHEKERTRTLAEADVVRLADLRYGEYKPLTPEIEALGIKAGDPGTTEAVRDDGSRTWVVLDVAEVQSRQAAAAKARRKQLRDAAKAKMQRVRDALAARPLDEARVAIVVYAALRNCAPSQVQTAVQAFLPDALEGINITQDWNQGALEALVERLARTAMLNPIVQIGAAAVMAAEIDRTLNEYESPVPALTDWYLDACPLTVHERLGVPAPKDSHEEYYLKQFEKALYGRDMYGYSSPAQLLERFPAETQAILRRLLETGVPAQEHTAPEPSAPVHTAPSAVEGDPRDVLTRLVVQYGILTPDEHASDLGLLEFAGDLFELEAADPADLERASVAIEQMRIQMQEVA